MTSALLRPLRRRAIPVADAPALAAPARRTTFARLTLAAALAAALLASVLAARALDPRASSYFAAGGGGIVVLDLSTSVDPDRYRRLARVLRTIVETGQAVGLVAYSDSAYEVLPPATRGEELRPLLRFFERPPASLDRRRRRPGGFGFIDTPWSGTFRGGTRISTGLRVAREVIARDDVRPATVLLVSDLDDSPFDISALTQEVIAYTRSGVELRVVPLFPAPEDRDLFVRLLGADALIANEELLANTALEQRQTLVGSLPVGLTLLAALFLVLLAINEHVCRRLTWRRGAPA